MKSMTALKRIVIGWFGRVPDAENKILKYSPSTQDDRLLDILLVNGYERFKPGATVSQGFLIDYLRMAHALKSIYISSTDPASRETALRALTDQPQKGG